MSVLLDDRWRVARKQHVCNVCYQHIEPGQRYRRQRMIDYDGEPATWKGHELCDTAYEEAVREGNLYPDEYPDFEEDIKPILARLAAGHNNTDHNANWEEAAWADPPTEYRGGDPVKRKLDNPTKPPYNLHGGATPPTSPQGGNKP